MDPSKANIKDTGLRDAAAVGSFGTGASRDGVEDVVGNVWEWTSDWYQAYPGNTADDAYYGEQCRVTRGAVGLTQNRKPRLSTATAGP